MIKLNKKFFFKQVKFISFKNSTQKRTFCQTFQNEVDKPKNSYLDQFIHKIQKADQNQSVSIQQFLQYQNSSNDNFQTWQELQNFFDANSENKTKIENQINLFVEQFQQTQNFESQDLFYFLLKNKFYKQTLKILKKVDLSKNQLQYQDIFNQILIQRFQNNKNYEEFLLVLQNLNSFLQKELKILFSDGLNIFTNNLLKNLFVQKQNEFKEVLIAFNDIIKNNDKIPQFLKQIVQFYKHCKVSNNIKYQLIAEADAFNLIYKENFVYLFDQQLYDMNYKQQSDLLFLDERFKDFKLNLTMTLSEYNLLKKQKQNPQKLLFLSQIACQYNDLQFFVDQHNKIKDNVIQGQFAFNFLKCLLRNIKVDQRTHRQQLISQLLQQCSKTQQNQIYLILKLKTNSQDVESSIIQNMFQKSLRNHLKQQLTYLVLTEINQETYQRVKQHINNIVDKVPAESLIKYTVIIQTQLGVLFDLVSVNEDFEQQQYFDEMGYMRENRQVLSEMEQKTSEIYRGESKFVPKMKLGQWKFCQEQMEIKKKLLLLDMIEQNKIHTLDDLKEAQKELGYNAEIDHRVVYSDYNMTFKQLFNEFYYKVQRGEFPVDNTIHKPEDILDITDLADLLMYALLKKNYLNGNVISKLRYATYIKETGKEFQENVRNLVETNCEDGLKLVKKYVNFFQCKIPQQYERLQVDQYEYAVDGFHNGEDLEQKKLQIAKSPFLNQIEDFFQEDYLSSRVLDQIQTEENCKQFQNFSKDIRISQKTTTGQADLTKQKTFDEFVADENEGNSDIQNEELKRSNILKVIEGDMDPQSYLQLSSEDQNTYQNKNRQNKYANKKANRNFQTFQDQINEDFDNDFELDYDVQQPKIQQRNDQKQQKEIQDQKKSEKKAQQEFKDGDSDDDLF